MIEDNVRKAVKKVIKARGLDIIEHRRQKHGPQDDFKGHAGQIILSFTTICGIEVLFGEVEYGDYLDKSIITGKTRIVKWPSHKPNRSFYLRAQRMNILGESLSSPDRCIDGGFDKCTGQWLTLITEFALDELKKEDEKYAEHKAEMMGLAAE